MSDKMHTLEATKGHMTPDMPMRELPSFSLTEKDLPAIKNWQVGKKYKLEIEVEQVSLSKDEYMMGEPISARFKIHKVKDNSPNEEEEKAKKGHY